MIALAVIGVMFPVFGSEYFRNKERARHLYYKCLKFVALLLLIPTLTIVLFAKPGIAIWINQEFAQNSYRIAQLVAIGAFFVRGKSNPLRLNSGCGKV
ncbi:MAG: hypothetical protein MZV64_26945 [Ignavibacteriales bacterium]|nr:hypothetical protein [Ignavibacteriales bacterium]